MRMSYRRADTEDWESLKEASQRPLLLVSPPQSPRQNPSSSFTTPRNPFSSYSRKPLPLVAVLMLVTLLMALSVEVVELRHETLLAGLRSLAPRLATFLQPVTETKHCNPFALRGYVHNSPNKNNTDVYWQPLNTSLSESCAPSRLFERHFLGSVPTPASWLQGRNHTILLIGDSIDRFHLWDVCEMMRSREEQGPESLPIESRLEKIGPDHPASPTPYTTPSATKEYQAKEVAMGKRDRSNTRPWVCSIRTDAGNHESSKTWLNFVNIFTFGIEDVGTMHDGQEFYYPPASFSARLKHIALPLIENLATYYSDLSFSAPSLVEFQSGMWDLRRWSQEDLTAHGDKPNALSSVFTDLNATRIEKQLRELKEMILDMGETFAEKRGPAKIPVPLSFRALHFVNEHHLWAPWPRAYALDSIDRQIISDLWRESKFEIKSRAASLKLHERLRINEWARLIEGQGHKFRDPAHPAANPGTIIWADYILWELRRAIKLQFD